MQQMIREREQRIGLYLKFFVKWTALALLAGAVCGAVGAVFHHLVELAGALFTSHSWLLYILPVSGLAVVSVYRMFGVEPEEMLALGSDNVLLNIWVFTGDNRQDHFNTSGMKWLRSSDNAIYAYSLPSSRYPELSLTEEQVANYFNAVAAEWASEVYS